jgi:hypothetical protein
MSFQFAKSSIKSSLLVKFIDVQWVKSLDRGHMVVSSEVAPIVVKKETSQPFKVKIILSLRQGKNLSYREEELL